MIEEQIPKLDLRRDAAEINPPRLKTPSSSYSRGNNNICMNKPKVSDIRFVRGSCYNAVYVRSLWYARSTYCIKPVVKFDDAGLWGFPPGPGVTLRFLQDTRHKMTKPTSGVETELILDYV